MKKAWMVILALVLALVLGLSLSGCGLLELAAKGAGAVLSDRSGDDEDDEEDEDEDDDEWDDPEEESGEKTDRLSRRAEKKKGAAKDDDETDEPAEEEHPDGELSAKELKEFEELFNDIAYNGFAGTSFDDPRNIDWNMVFYNGAGIDADLPFEKVMNAYLKETGESELLGDLTYIYEEDMLQFVKDTSGYSYKSAHYPLQWWVYLEDLGVYVSEHGDTNYAPVDVERGYVENGVYSLDYEMGGCGRTITFKKNGDRWQFLSNIIFADYSEEPDTMYDEYLLPDSDTRKLTEEDLDWLSADGLRYARNEIYARHGRRFADKELQAYFDTKSWYYGTIDPSDWSESYLNSVETYNVDFISKYEKKKK